MKKRNGVVTHVVFDETSVRATNDEAIRSMDLKELMAHPGVKVEEISVVYTDHAESNYVRPKGKSMGNGCYRSVRRAAAE